MADAPGAAPPEKVGWYRMIRDGYEELVNAIIRPPRATYEVADLGPSDMLIGDMAIRRSDLELVGPRGKLQCSHWQPRRTRGASKVLPCVVYLHGNCGCRVEALDVLELILGAGMTLFTLDFGGCGMSEGEYISLGWYEREDVNEVVKHLRSTGETSCIGLWGRSMGAVTSLMHGDRDPSIAALVLDSPFANLRVLANELVDQVGVSIPRMAVGAALSMVKSSVKKRAGFSVDDLSPVDHAATCYIPALFAAADGDDFIRPHHSNDIYEKYAGDKNIVSFDGDHNSRRPPFFYSSASIFLQNTLSRTAQLMAPPTPDKPLAPAPADEEEDALDLAALHGVGGGMMGPRAGPQASTADAALVEQMGAMGFNHVASVRAAKAVDNISVTAAVQWLVMNPIAPTSHPEGPAGAKEGAGGPMFIPEEAEAPKAGAGAWKDAAKYELARAELLAMGFEAAMVGKALLAPGSEGDLQNAVNYCLRCMGGA